MPASAKTKKLNDHKPKKWLTPPQIARLREQRAKGASLQTLAARFGITISAASRIANHARRAVS